MSRKAGIFLAVLAVLILMGGSACGQLIASPSPTPAPKPIRYGDFLYYTRPVHILITRTLPAEKWKDVLKVAELPLAYRQQINSDGTLTLPVEDNFQTPVVGLLWGDYVITASTSIDRLRNLSPQELKEYTIIAKLLADPSRAVEDPSTTEIIVQGKADLLIGVLNDPRFYIAQGLAVFQRLTPMPIRVFPTPQGAPYTLGTMRSMTQFDEVLSVALIRKAMGLKRTFFIVKDPLGPWDYIDGSFGLQEIGSPVFRVADGAPELVGIIVDSGSPYGYDIGIAYDIQALLGILPIKLPRTSSPTSQGP